MGQEPVPTFVGRERELAALHAALGEAEVGRGRLVLVTGEPGIGKSSLVDAFASQASQHGATMLWGAAWEDGGAPAYWPWVQVLRGLVADRDPSVAPAPGMALLGRLLPELAGLDPPRSGDEVERFALFDAVVGALESASRAGPLVVVLEDLHAAGIPSALLLQFVAQHTHGVPVLLVATYRDVEARLASGLGEIIAALEGAGDVLSLPAMSLGEVREIVSRVLPDVSTDLVATIMERTRGNPLFVAQVARLVVAEAPGSVRPSTLPIPAGIRQAVRQRLDRLAESGELSRGALTVGAVIGGEVDLDELSAVLDTSADGLLEVLGPAVRSGLLVELGPQRYRFAHALVREAIHFDLGSKERAALHHRIATALAQRGPSARDHARLARHFHAAVPVGDAEAAVRHATAAGEEAMTALAYEEAAGHFQQALSDLHHAEGDRTEQRCELLLSLGTVLIRAGDLGRAGSVLVQATEHARRSGNGELLGRAALLRTKHLEFHVVDHEAIALLEEATGALDGIDTPILAHLFARLGFALQHHDPDGMAEAADRAVEAAGRSGNPAALATARSMRLHSRWGRHEPRAALAEAEELVRLVGRTGDPELAVTAHMWCFTFSMELGEPAGAQAALDRLTELAERSHQPPLMYLATSRASSLAALTGHLDEALALADEALQIGLRADLPDAEGVHWAQLFAVRRFRELPAEHEARMERMLRDVVLHSAQEMTPEPALVLVELAHGDRAAAAARFESLVEVVPELRRDMFVAWNLAMLAEACVGLGATTHADMLYAALLPLSGRFAAASGVLCVGAVDHFLAGLAALAGRPDDAERHYEAAIEQHRLAGAVPMLARSREEYATLRQGREPGVEVEATVRGRPATAATTAPEGEFRRSGRVWQLRWEGTAATAPDTKGMRDLAVLLAAPDREVPALDLVEAAGGPRATAAGGHAGERLDHTARTAYRQRLADLEDELAEAEDNADVGRVAALRREQEFLAAELAGALGLGGRARTEGDPVERARKAVTMRIRTALKAIAEVNPGLARHLDRSVTTGRLCAYRPERPVRWHL